MQPPCSRFSILIPFLTHCGERRYRRLAQCEAGLRSGICCGDPTSFRAVATARATVLAHKRKKNAGTWVPAFSNKHRMRDREISYKASTAVVDAAGAASATSASAKP